MTHNYYPPGDSRSVLWSGHDTQSLFVGYGPPRFILLFAGCASSPSSSGTTTTPVTPAVVPPTVTSVTPATAPAGAAALTLTINGTGFTSSTGVQVGSVVEPTTFVSATQVTASVAAAQIAQGALLPVIALNGNATSASGTVINFEVDNPAPAITSFTPSTILSGSASSLLAITGTGFVPTTSILVGTTSRPASFVSPTQVNLVLTAADLASAGTIALKAVNPAPGGGTSAAASLPVSNPTPGAITVTPATLTTGAATPTTVTVAGSNFVPGSVVQIGTSARATTYVSPTQLTFQLSVADQAAAARLSISVVNPAPGGGTSASATLALNAPSPTPLLTSVSPAQLVISPTPASIYVYGSNLSSTAVVQWNGTPLTTSYFTSNYSGPYLAATVPASLLAAAATVSITVNSPTSVPSLSNSLSLAVVNPPAPTLTSISPATGPINTATLLTLTGTGFTSSSTVSLNGASIAATMVSSTSLTVNIPAASLELPGNYSLLVTTPAPGGGTTVPATFTAYIPIVNNSMIFNPVNGLFYVSVPGSVGVPYGNSVVSVDPATGALGTPIQVGSEPNKLALTSDGKYLWVGLDGAGSVRKVDLTAGQAGLQFYLGGNAGVYNSPLTALALAALPGQTDSVVVQTSTPIFNSYLNVYDSGVLRGTGTSLNLYPSGNYALLVDGTRTELYAAGSGYTTYTYGASGLTLKATSTTSATYASSGNDEIQIVGGHLYTDFGKVFDAESGAALGTFYATGTSVATGTTTVDSALGKVFILDSSTLYGNPSQIQIFNTSDFNPTTSSVIPLSITYGTSYTTTPNRLTRWGSNGLAFRTAIGVYSLRSNLVKDLSTTSADLAVTLAATGATTTGASTTYTATVTNSGPAAATGVSVLASLPSSGVLVSATPSAGTCSSGSALTCDLGTLASGSSLTVAFVVQQSTAGSATMQVQVSASENDPVTSNNQASASVTVTGSTVSSAPTLSSISPAAIIAGSTDTVLTVTGTGFINGSSIVLGTIPLTTSFVSATQLTATVPAARLASLGWLPVTVTTPSPGGGTSSPTPLTIFSVLTAGLNHILYDPYSQQIMASVGSGSSAVTGNSIAAINPAAASIGTPVPIGSQPTNLALTSDGQILYTILAGNESVARFNMLTQAADFTYTVPATNTYSSLGLRDIATQPGTENTIALDLGSYTGIALYDFNPATKSAAIRGQATGPYTGSCLQYLDSADLFSVDIDTSGSTFDHYTVSASGFSYYNYSQFTTSTLSRFGCFKINGGIAYSNGGGVANPATTPATQLGVFPSLSLVTSFSNLLNVAPDTSLQRVFFAANSTGTSYANSPDSIEVFNPKTFLLANLTPFPFAAIEGSTSFTVSDVIRWGQDGLAILTNDHLYLMRGPLVVPQLLTTGSAATLSSVSSTSVAHGSGNITLTLTGANFMPGVAILWNGAYRTTTITDAAHVIVNIPASDLAATGSATLTAVNPGATPSSALTFTIN